MRIINRDTDYAIRSLVYMAKSSDSMITVKELVDGLDMPRAFSRRLLQKLSKKGLLRSLKGKYGGFEFKREPSLIRVVDLINIFQKGFSDSNCIFKKKVCPDRISCPLRKKLCQIEDSVVKELSGVTIEELARG